MRLSWLDTLKGIGIILVVLAHHSIPKSLETYIFSFHMPLFFFISGYLFHVDKYSESVFVKKKFKSLVIPYFSFTVITCLFYYLLDAIYQPEITNIEFIKYGVIHNIYSIMYASGPLLSYNPPLWFLTCLFVTELLFLFICKKYYSKPKKLIFWLTTFGIIGYLYSIYIPFRLPWNADVALVAVVFYGVGYIFREQSTSSNLKRAILCLFIFLNLFYLINVSSTYQKVDMIYLHYGNFFSFYLLAFAGIFAFVYIGKKIGHSTIFEYYGRNSLIVLSLHVPMWNILLIVVTLFLGTIPEHNLKFALGLTILNLVLMIPVIFIINNYCPVIIGQSGSFRLSREIYLGHKQ